jgi:hypothetical protein
MRHTRSQRSNAIVGSRGDYSKVCTHKSRLSGNHWLIVRIAPESGLIADIGGWSQMC